MITSEIQDVPVKDMDITVRAKNVLTALGLHTKRSIYIAFLLGTVPRVGTIVKHYPYVNIDLPYTRLVNEEVKTILREFSVNEKELSNVGY